MNSETSYEDRLRHQDAFAEYLDGALAARGLRDGAVAARLCEETSLKIDRRRVNEWRRGRKLPPTELEVKALEVVAELKDGSLVTPWRTAWAAKHAHSPREVSRLNGEASRSLTGHSPVHETAVAKVEEARQRLYAAIAKVPEAWMGAVRECLIDPFLEAAFDSLLIDLGLAQTGLIRLSADQYYELILDEIKRADRATRVTAVSTLSSRFWLDEPEQASYLALNIEAAAKGAQISRVIITDRRTGADISTLLLHQRDAGIDVRVLRSDALADTEELDLEDFVTFADAMGRRSYVARPVHDGTGRIRSGRLILAAAEIDALEAGFRRARRMAQ